MPFTYRILTGLCSPLWDFSYRNRGFHISEHMLLRAFYREREKRTGRKGFFNSGLIVTSRHTNITSKTVNVHCDEIETLLCKF